MHEGNHGILDDHKHDDDDKPKLWHKIVGAVVVVLAIIAFVLLRRVGL